MNDHVIRRDWRAPVAALVCALWASPAVARSPIALELGGGAAIPIGRFIDAQSGVGHNTVENGAAGSMDVSLLLGGFTLRWSSSWITLGRQDILVSENIQKQINDFREQLGLAPIEREKSAELDGAAHFGALAAGYRFTILSGRWQPYVPLELGIAVVESESLSRSLYGLTAGTGLGLDVRAWDRLWVGVAVRYQVFVTEADQSMAALGLVATEDAVASSLAVLHLVTTSLHVQVRY